MKEARFCLRIGLNQLDLIAANHDIGWFRPERNPYPERLVCNGHAWVGIIEALIAEKRDFYYVGTLIDEGRIDEAKEFIALCKRRDTCEQRTGYRADGKPPIRTQWG